MRRRRVRSNSVKSLSLEDLPGTASFLGSHGVIGGFASLVTLTAESSPNGGVERITVLVAPRDLVQFPGSWGNGAAACREPTVGREAGASP